MTLPTLMASSLPVDPGLRTADDEGKSFEVRLYSTSGLTYTYTRELVAIYGAAVVSATWRMDRVGGVDHGEIVIQSGIDLSTATNSEYEIQIERAGEVVYTGRVANYENFTEEKTGEVRTRITTEGYVTKLADIKVSGVTWAAGTTVKSVVQDLCTSFLQIQSRITFTASNVVGAYALAGSFTPNGTVLSVLRTLALLQGSTEWGISESSPPHLYFVPDSTAVSETAHVMLGKDAGNVSAGGSMQRAINRVKILGSWSGGSQISGTYNDAAAQALYGIREYEDIYPAISHATDAQRLAQNIVALLSAGETTLSGTIVGPQARVEPARTTAGAAITGTPKVTFHGVDGVQQAELPERVEYRYQKGSPVSLAAHVWAGAVEENAIQILRRHARKIEALAELGQQSSGGGGGVASVTGTAPIASSGGANPDISVADMTGDAGAGGTRGTVPAPAAGDAAAGKYLKADGVWTVPPAGGAGYWSQAAGVLSPTTAADTVEITAALKRTGAITPATITASVDDYNPAGLATASVLILNTDAAWTMSGLTAQPDGTVITLTLYSGGTLRLAHDSAASGAANRMNLGEDVVLQPGHSLSLRYYTAAARWQRMEAQGTGPFTTELLTASGRMLVTGEINPPMIGADTNDYNPAGLLAASILKIYGDAAWTITGLVYAAGMNDKLLFVVNVSAPVLTLAHEGAGSGAANRFYFAGAVDLTLPQYASVLLRYDATAQRWLNIGAIGAGGGGVGPHAATHQDAGADEISVAGLSGALADPQTPTAHAASHQDGGADEISVAGLSGALADPQTPTAHAASHQDGGTDEVAVAAPAANAIPKAGAGGTLDVGWVPDLVGDAGAGGTHGLVPAPGAGDAAADKYLKANGAWAVLPAGNTEAAANRMLRALAFG